MITNVLKSAYDEAFSFVLKVVEHNIVPDPLVRAGIRSLLAQRAKESTPGSGEEFQEKMQAFVEELKNMPVAVETDAANEQHYEVPTEYFNAVLGPHRKYSSCLYPPGTTSLEDAEVAMLAMCSDRAELANGQNILELGCGWGSWSLYMAENFPGSTITAVSNSRTQKQYIDAQAKKKRLEELDCGKLFVHIFVHRIGLPYHYEVNGPDDWMTKYFFSGGTMPSMNLLLHFQEDLAVQKQWYVNGTHYSKTLEAWLEKHDKEKKLIMPLFEETYGKDQALKWFVYWRLFYLACSELFKYQHGERWGVGHYLFVKNKR
ncbi:hypothetical protein Ndes2437B_g08837 [Nannochloris sp. 'desiccata']